MTASTSTTTTTTSANALLAQQRAAEERERQAAAAREAQQAAQAARAQAQSQPDAQVGAASGVRAKNPFAVPSLFETMRPDPVDLRPTSKPDAAAKLAGATAAHDDAAEAYANTETRLQRELTAVGHTLSPEQQKTYTQEFWQRPENAEVKAEEQQTADALSKTLRRTGPMLERSAKRDGTGAETLLDANLSLAKSPKHADGAMEFAKRLDQNPELFEAIDAATEGELQTTLQDELVATALPYVQAEIFAQHGGEADGVARQGALEDFRELLSGFSTVKGATGIGAHLEQLDANLAAAMKGDFDPVMQQVDAWADASKFSRALTTATFAQSMFAAGDAFAQGEVMEGIKNAAGGAQAGIQLAGQVLSTFDEASKAASAAGTLAGFASKALPALGLAADAIQLGQDISELSDGAEAGEIVSLVGTGISLVGDVAGFVPVVGTAVDQVLGAVGGVVHLIGDLISGGDDDPTAPDEAEMSELLQETLGVDSDLASTLVERGLESEAARLGALGLTPAQVRDVMTDESLHVDAYGQEVQRPLLLAMRLAGGYGVTKDDAYTFIKDAVTSFNSNAMYLPEIQILDGVITRDYFANDAEALRAHVEESWSFDDALLERLQTQGSGEPIWAAFDYTEA